jgi:hypothetical protein
MQNVGLILLVFAFVFACIASRWQSFAPWHMGWLAVACWIASELVGGVAKLIH